MKCPVRDGITGKAVAAGALQTKVLGSMNVCVRAYECCHSMPPCGVVLEVVEDHRNMLCVHCRLSFRTSASGHQM